MRITATRLFLVLMGFLLWAALSFALLRGWAPALVSSRDTAMVILGFVLPFIWLAATASIAWHLFTRRRAAATSKE
ncbi:hypothetical protein [Pseudomonas oryzihabitans]|uniref:hypothetical protein n=1 Tax=Pseudomonas oryzihabitans TaxID=47885 RepID=UPI00241DA584|nr:hypothetical protein [Pseudomonas oryzihabitans]